MPRTHEHGQHQEEQNLHPALEAEPRPWIAARRKGLAPVPDLRDPPLVVAGHSLADEVVQLARELERNEEEDDPFRFDLAAQGVAPAHDRDVAVLLGDRESHDGREDEEDLDAVEEQLLASRWLFSRVGHRHARRIHRHRWQRSQRWLYGNGRGRHGWSLRTRRELKIVSMSWL